MLELCTSKALLQLLKQFFAHSLASHTSIHSQLLSVWHVEKELPY